jgi:hypothetical protein
VSKREWVGMRGDVDMYTVYYARVFRNHVVACLYCTLRRSIVALLYTCITLLQCAMVLQCVIHNYTIVLCYVTLLCVQERDYILRGIVM